jgi:hypothetical protein
LDYKGKEVCLLVWMEKIYATGIFMSISKMNIKRWMYFNAGGIT